MELDYAKIAAKGFPQPAARVYLFQGSDDALKREAAARLTDGLLDPSFVDFDREERDAPASETAEGDAARQILASAAGAPMASARRVVIVTNIQRLGKGDQEILAAGLPKLGALSCLVLIAAAQEYEAGKAKGRQAVGAKLVNAVVKAGVTVLCDAPGAGDLKSRAHALLNSRGKTIEPAALEILIARAVATASDRGGAGKTGDIHVLTNELEKTIAYAGARAQITRADAAAVGTTGADENIFALLDAVGHRNARKALAETEELLRAGSRADGVAARTFVMLARHLRLLWGAKYLAENRVEGYNARGGVPPEVQSMLSGEVIGLTQRQSFLLKGLQEQARGWTYPALQAALGRVLTSDMAMKGIAPVRKLGSAAAASDDPASNLRLLVVDLCRPAENPLR